MKRISTRDLPINATMAHVAVAAGVFPSATQARKNGIDGPIVLGVNRITKKVSVEIVDAEVEKTEQSSTLDDSFWPNYREPETNVARAVQYPMYGVGYAERIVNAYFQDAIEARKALRKMQTTKNDELTEDSTSRMIDDRSIISVGEI